MGLRPEKEGIPNVTMIPAGQGEDFGVEVLHEPEEDALDRARHVWKKGRLEFMGGPVYFEQGHNTTFDEFNPETLQIEKVSLMDNNRRCTYGYPMGTKTDPIAHDLGVDETEQ